VLGGGDLKAVNTVDTPDRVKPEQRPVPKMDGGKLNMPLDKSSWNVIRLSKAER
jgi:alpha-L-arabinofuranosidase